MAPFIVEEASDPWNIEEVAHNMGITGVVVVCALIEKKKSE